MSQHKSHVSHIVSHIQTGVSTGVLIQGCQLSVSNGVSIKGVSSTSFSSERFNGTEITKRLFWCQGSVQTEEVLSWNHKTIYFDC